MVLLLFLRLLLLFLLLLLLFLLLFLLPLRLLSSGPVTPPTADGLGPVCPLWFTGM